MIKKIFDLPLFVLNYVCIFQCDPGAGMDALYNLIYRKPQLHMVIGSACSDVTKTLAEIVPYWNLILVGEYAINKYKIYM